MTMHRMTLALTAALAVLGLMTGSASAQVARQGTVTVGGPTQPALPNKHFTSVVIEYPTVSVPWSGPVNLSSRGYFGGYYGGGYYGAAFPSGGYSVGTFLNYGPYSGQGFSSIQPLSAGYAGFPITAVAPVYVPYEVPIFAFPSYLSPTNSTWGLDNRRPGAYGYYR